MVKKFGELLYQTKKFGKASSFTKSNLAKLEAFMYSIQVGVHKSSKVQIVSVKNGKSA